MYCSTEPWTPCYIDRTLTLPDSGTVDHVAIAVTFEQPIFPETSLLLRQAGVSVLLYPDQYVQFDLRLSSYKLTVTFDDLATKALPFWHDLGPELQSGSCRPFQPLSASMGRTPPDLWTPTIGDDDIAGYTRYFNSALAVTVGAAVPEPGT